VTGLSAARHAHVPYTTCKIIHICVRMLDSVISNGELVVGKDEDPRKFSPDSCVHCM